MAQLQYIQISKIEGHPGNPRKDLGDLSELAESIRTKGILQNLTVVQREAGFCTSCALYNGAKGNCSEGFDKDESPPCSKWESAEKYTVVIGHRRLAAAKLAGLTEVPCVVAEMSPRDQLATMLLENMQRSDLTLWEQAHGFQMMLDLGETVNAISEATGLSESTVRRRMKLLDLDSAKLMQAVERGGTLQDYAELDKIEDAERRNAVLDKIGTDNFRYELKRAIAKEQEECKIAAIVEKVSEFATQVDSDDGYRYARSYNSYDNPGEIVPPDDADTVPYFFVITNYGYVRLLTEKPDVEEPDSEKEALEAATRAKEERRTRLEEITKRAYELRYYFVKTCSVPKKHLKSVVEFIARHKLEGGWENFDDDKFCKIMDIDLGEDEELEFGHVSERLESSPEKMLLLLTYCTVGDGISAGYYENWSLKYRENTKLDNIYRMLEVLGYRMSDEERALKDGTHELLEGEVEAEE